MLQNKSTINSFRLVFLVYILSIMTFSILLLLPISHKQKLGILDAIFISTSALSGSGMSTINILEEFTWTGKIILALEMQAGGIGILVLISYLFMMMGKRLTMGNMLLVSRDQNQGNFKLIRSLSLSVLVISLLVEGIGCLLMYNDIHQMIQPTKEAIFVTIFHSISSFTGNGFDLFGSGFISFQHDSQFLLVTAALIFIGGLGYPTIVEYLFYFNKRKSLFSRINLKMHSLLLFIGAVLFFALEYNHGFSHISWVDKLSNAIFFSASSRSAGFLSVDLSQMTMASFLVLMVLMYIGGASSSPSGGIRLTTFAVLLAKMKAIIKSEEDTVIGKKAISEEAVNNSILIAIGFMVLIIVSTILLALTQTVSLEIILLEVVSAVTTTGISLGLTSHLTVLSKIVIIILMLVGRIGIFTLIYFVFNFEKTKSRYLKEDLPVG